MYPDIMNLGPLTLHSYGLFISIGFAFGIVLALYRASKINMDASLILDMSIYAIISAIVGSRIFYIIVNYPEYLKNPIKVFYIHKGGLVFYGGLIGALATLSYYMIKHKLEYLKVADLLIVCLPLGHFFGRIGCFLNGCCYGAHTTAPTGIIFPNLRDNVMRHPTQLYESAFCLSAFFLLLLIEKYIKKTEGVLFVSYIYMYSAWRFSIEFLRDDDRGAFLLGLSPSQNISLLGFLFASIFLYLIIKNRKSNEIKKGV